MLQIPPKITAVTSCAVQHSKGFQKFTSLFVCDALTVKKIPLIIKMKSLLFLVLISVCWAEPHPDNSSLEHERIIHIQGKEILEKIPVSSDC